MEFTMIQKKTIAGNQLQLKTKLKYDFEEGETDLLSRNLFSSCAAK